MHDNYNYTELRGGTGPLVYPAGFVYMFSGLYWATDFGANVRRAQLIFTGLYLATFATVAAIYAKAARPSNNFHPLLLGTLCLSKRVHSIFVLRLFNDGPTMLLLYLAILCFVHKRWTVGCAIFSVRPSPPLALARQSRVSLCAHPPTHTPTPHYLTIPCCSPEYYHSVCLG
eukprot:COSAG05_NODE_3007_length_2419_cov_2.225000_2_plen_172_part_00